MTPDQQPRPTIWPGLALAAAAAALALVVQQMLPGKSRSGRYAFAIPKMELGDVTVEVSLGGDIDRDSAVFAGAAK